MSASSINGWPEPPASPTAVGGSGGGSARSPSRLRCTYSPVRGSGAPSANGSAADASGGAKYPQRPLSPCIVRVDHIGGGGGGGSGGGGSSSGSGSGSGHAIITGREHETAAAAAAAAAAGEEEDVRIEHVEPDEARRRAEVEAGIISQVDGMAAYFTALADADAAAIARLQSAVAAKDLVIGELQRQGAQQQGQQPQQPQPQQHQHQQHARSNFSNSIFLLGNDGNAPRGGGWAASRKCTLAVALAALALVVVIVGLAAGLGTQRARQPRAGAALAPPEFVRAPVLLSSINGSSSSSSSSSSSLNIQVALTQPGTLHYAVVRAGAAWEGSAAAVAQAAAGLLGDTALEGVAVACGQLPIPLANVDFTLSIGNQTTSAECAQAAPLGADGRAARKSCARCPSLQPSAPYVVYLAPSRQTSVGALASVEVASGNVARPATSTPASTAISRGGSAPAGGGLYGDAMLASARVAAAGDAGFNLTFSLFAPGTLQFVVVPATLLARAGRAFVAFDVDPEAALVSSIADSVPAGGAAPAEANGAVVRGACTLAAANVAATCRIGPGGGGGQDGDAPGAYACSSNAQVSCVVDNACFGGLCEASAYAILPETGYNVFGQAVGSDGGDVGGAPRLLGSFRTAAPQRAPRPLPGLRVDAASVRPDRFAITGVGQDRPGFAYVLVARLDDLVAAGVGQQQVVQAGQATNFTATVPPARRRKRLRALLATAPTGNVTLLPPEVAAPAAGSSFLPPCAVTRACATDTMVKALLGAAPAALAECVPVQRGGQQEPATVLAPRLADDTAYRVLVATSDADGRVAVWTALVRTQDATPPALTVVRVQPPGFTSVDVVAALNEPGVVYGAIAPSSAARNATGVATCPPTYRVPQMQEMSQVVPAAAAEVVFSFTGLQANSDYDVTFIGRDAAGNCQAQTTVVSVHTADDVPPVTLALRVVDTLGDGADLGIQLDEPATAYFVAMELADGGGAAAACPEPADIFAAAGGAGTTTGATYASAGRLDVPARAPAEAILPVRGLRSETRYAACVVAEDATQQRNRQTTAALIQFQTRDVTPPTARIDVINGTDGGSVSCQHAPPYTCRLAWTAALSEPGWARWALFVNDSSFAQAVASAGQSLAIDGALLTTAPTMAAVLRLNNLSSAAVAEGNLTFPPAQSAVIELTGLASATSYVLLLAPRDDASPQPNVPAAPTIAAVVAPDVTPPVLQAASLVRAADTQLDFSVTVNEAATVAFVLRRASSPDSPDSPPSVDAVLAAGRGNSSQPGMADAIAAGLLTAAANKSVSLSVTSGLAPGTLYDLLLAAVDAAGNPQLEVTTLRGIRTTDSAPPLVADLRAVWAPPMRLTLTATASKPGLLRFILQHNGTAAQGAPSSAPPASARGLLNAVAANDLARANFTGTLALQPAAANGSSGAVGAATLCIADAADMVLHAVAQDQEGQYAGRWPNNSTLTSVQVQVAPVTLGASCEPAAFLASLRPELAFAADGPGLMLGAANSSADAATGAVTWTQAAGAFMKGAASDQSAAADLQAAQTVVSAGASLIGPGPSITVKASAPASASMLVLSRALVPEGPSAVLRLSYQLRDAGGGTAVDTTGVTLSPRLAFAAATDPSLVKVDANATHALPDCAAAGGGRLADPASGIGECSVVVEARFFPSAGSVDATITLQIMFGSDLVIGATEAQPLQLVAPPNHAPFLPSSPGVIVSLPVRPLYTGEPFDVVVAAANPTGTGITGWALPLRYDPDLLELEGVAPSELWQRADVAVMPSGGGGGVVGTITASARAAGQPAERYRSSSSIPLATVKFIVRGRVAATYDHAVSAVVSGVMLSPDWSAPPIAFRDQRAGSGSGGEGASGSITIAETRVVGLWAWSESSDIFNTAALNGVRVSTRLFAASVRNWGVPAAVPALPSSCTVNATNALPGPSIEPGGCVLHIDGNALSLTPARMAVATLGANGLTATATFNVWQPARAAVAADDPVLNSVLPLNAAPSTPGCNDRYQATRLRALVDWTNSADVLAATDVTALVAFASNNTRSVAVAGATARGLSLGAAAINFGASSMLATTAATTAVVVLTVTDEPACLLALEPLAVTGVDLSTYASSLAAAPAAESVERGSNMSLAWRAAQRLQWEGAQARVVTVARFDDGTAVDVSDRAVLSLLSSAGAALDNGGTGASTAVLPFALSSDASGAQLVTVNASISGAGPSTLCSSFLQATWEVCSQPLGSGAGRLLLALPAPRAISLARAQPDAIAPAGDPATLAPLLLPTTAALSLQVDFSDGTTRDFSRDDRTSFTVAVGSTLCHSERGPDGSWRLAAAANSTVGPAGDSCTVTAAVAFADAAPLEANITVQIVAVRGVALYALPPTTLVVPELPPAAPTALAPLGTSLRLLRCDARNYDSVTLWPAAALTNCSGGSSGGGAPCAPTASIANRGWVALASSNASVATVGAGYPARPASPTYPLLDNRLVAATVGTTVVSLAFGSAAAEVRVSVEDTYAAGWPRAAPVAGGAAAVAVEAQMVADGFVVTALAVPSASARLAAPDALTAAEVEARGLALAPDPSRGPLSLSATIAGLAPGTNYTVLLAVRRGASLASGVTALAGALVPDVVPPSFTAAAVSGAAANATTGAFAARVDVGLDEPGAVSYAAYYGGGGGSDGDGSGSACLTADPTVGELRSGANMADAGKCACGSAYCSPAARGRIAFSGAGPLRDAVVISGALPVGPYEALRGAGSDVLSCAPPWEPRAYAPRGATLYLVAEDDAPNYAGWGSSCGGGGDDDAGSSDSAASLLPGPCAATTVVQCNNTPPARESTNVQAPPFALWNPFSGGSSGGYGSDAAPSAAPPLPPLRSPLRVPLTLPAQGSGPIAFVAAEFGLSTGAAGSDGSSGSSGSSAGVALKFEFALDRPGLVRYALVRNVVEVLAWGMRPAYAAGAREAVVLSRDCAGAPLPPGTAYGVWYNATDAYGAASPLRLLSLSRR